MGQGKVIILNAYVLQNRASKFMRQKLTKLKGEIRQIYIFTAVFNFPFLAIIQAYMYKIRKTI